MSENFPAFAKAVEQRFAVLSKNELFLVDVERDELWGVYLGAFPEGTNPIFRVRTEHDGSYDRAFVRHVGHVVAIVDGKIETIWDKMADLPHPYDVVSAALAAYVRTKAIKSVFRVKESVFGHKPNVEYIDNKTYQFTHFYTTVAASHRHSAPDAERGRIGTNLGVFKRGCEELTIDALNTVIDLINSNNLYRGQEHSAAVSGFYRLKTDYDAAPDKDIFLWANVTNRSALFRNTVIGTLVTDLSAGEDLEGAVRKFESKVAPQNYKRPTALITPKMVEQAVDKLKELDLEGAVERRFAKLSDVSVNNVLFVNNDVRGQMKDGSLTGLLMEEVKPKSVDVKNAEDISIEDFFKHKLPLASSIDLLVENRHLGNFMSLTAPVHENTGRLFKWGNDFAWSYDGDVTDSIKERVKAAGGNIDARLRVSLAWHNADDLDLHAQAPDGHIYYRQRFGVLDVDMNGMDRHDAENPVENLSWRDPRDGHYEVWVHQYSQRRRERGGFEVEIAINGSTRTFSYPKILAQNDRIDLFTFDVRNSEVINLKPGAQLTATSGSIDKWGLSTETLVPVNTLLASPNHWDGQEIGNKHWFFILKDCVNPDQARGIYNEFLRGELEPHRKVFEILGAKTKTPKATEQLSGLGFSSTRQDSATVVVKGATINKAFRINF
ncbi:hypothetical protein [Shinella zoogloeoides]|uniref:hypothetical protein n=1 Tax=Shinella zoogloeoides TaxID=352475 RepID=UPI002740222E|nr:hypothetical protein [Shinella zoogloeoides]WLR90918.1 hypothetical protein Q9316_00645 [Shinella zoogloeoides]